MEMQEIDKDKKIVIVGELPFFYDPADDATQKLLENARQVGGGPDTYEVRLSEFRKAGKKKSK